MLAIYFASLRKFEPQPTTHWHDPQAGVIIQSILVALKLIALYGGIVCFILGILVHAIGDKEKVAPGDAKEAFDKARNLGLIIHTEYMKIDSGFNDAQLLDLARDLYVKDVSFRGLWDEVRAHPPGEEDIPWLSLWRTA